MSADPAFTGRRALPPALTPHLRPGETLRWASRPDVYSILRSKSALWWIGVPWLAFWLGVYLMGWLSWDWFTPFGLVGFAFIAAPFILLYRSDSTLYAITDRRALIVHGGAKPETVSVGFEQMDDELEIIPTQRSAGHVYFASNFSTRRRDVDHIGKIAFRDVANAEQVAKILNDARKR